MNYRKCLYDKIEFMLIVLWENVVDNYLFIYVELLGGVLIEFLRSNLFPDFPDIRVCNLHTSVGINLL